MDDQYKGITYWRMLVLVLAIITVAIFPVASLGTRFSVWSWEGAITAVRYDFYLGIIVIALALLTAIIAKARKTEGTWGMLLLSCMLSLIMVIIIGYLRLCDKECAAHQ